MEVICIPNSRSGEPFMVLPQVEREFFSKFINKYSVYYTLVPPESSRGLHHQTKTRTKQRNMTCACTFVNPLAART
jgi:hypothetical protein